VTLRETFDQLNESVEDYVDRIADRCVKIGGVANSTERVLATWWHLLCSPDAVCRNHARVIATALESFGELLRQTTDTANEFGDFESAEMFTEISDGVEKWHLTLVTS
jgi:starvation-inducible DNA-binding protein